MTTSAMNDDDNYDAFEAMLNRGAYLRMLRELEAQDEAERAANAEEEDEREHWGANQLVSLADKDVPVLKIN